jgi:hypothetical protein
MIKDTLMKISQLISSNLDVLIKARISTSIILLVVIHIVIHILWYMLNNHQGDINVVLRVFFNRGRCIWIKVNRGKMILRVCYWYWCICLKGNCRGRGIFSGNRSTCSPLHSFWRCLQIRSLSAKECQKYSKIY